MKPKLHTFGALLLTSLEASAAECPPGSSIHLVDSVKKCVLDANIIVVIDPDWLVAGGVALVLLLLLTFYLAIQVGRLAKESKGGNRSGRPGNGVA